MNQHQQFRDPAEIRHAIGREGAFSLNAISGDIRLRGADSDEVTVIARASGHEEWLPIVVRRGEGLLSIEVDQKQFSLFGWFRSRADVEFDVSLPRAARVEVNAVSADIEARDLVGEQSYRTVSGDLSIYAAGGRIGSTTVSGDIRLDAEHPVEPRLSTTSGDFEIAAPSIRALQLRTVSGDVDVRAAFETGAIHNIETVSGDVAIEAQSGLTVDVKRGLDLTGNGSRQRVVGNGAARLRFRSLSGDLDLSGAPTAAWANAAEPPAPEPVAPVYAVPPVPPAPPAGPVVDSLEVLRALERGEIDVEEAQRRLEGAGSRG